MKDDIFDNNDALPVGESENSEENETNTTAVEAETAAENNEPAEDKNNIGADIIRGHINTIILRALYERDKYGYEIINDIEQKSHKQYTLKQPTLYSALKRLENQGYIIAYWKTDEVTSGGRRKYFTLTDSGKEITEKNLAEWEYSRTIIDSLISDRSFDFTQPAPTPVDFTILRNSVSRVPVVREDIDGEEETQAENKEIIESKQTEVQPEQSAAEEQPSVMPTVNYVQQQATTVQSEYVVQQNVQQNETQKNEKQYSNVLHQLFSQQNQPVQEEQLPPPPAEPQPSDEELAARKQAHENYLRLISEPVEQKPVEDIVPNSVNVNANKLLYNVKPDTERDYKNLINGIYEKAITNGSVQTNYHVKNSRQTADKRKTISNNSTKIINRGRADGVRISPSYEYEARTNYATKTTYNKGLTFLMCSGVVLFILLIEFIFCMIFRDNLKVSVAYPIVILLIGIVQFAVFGALYFKGYGANCAKPMTNMYLSRCIIVTILAILIICVSSFLFNINFSLASDVMKLIVIPSITALNIIVFAVSFKFLTK